MKVLKKYFYFCFDNDTLFSIWYHEEPLLERIVGQCFNRLQAKYSEFNELTIPNCLLHGFCYLTRFSKLFFLKYISLL